MANRILLKRSSVANAAPQASDLEYGELAINYNTGSLYFKNSSNAVQVIASTTSGAVPGGANTQVQFNDNGLFAGSAAFTFNKTSNLVSMSGNVTATGNISAGNVVTTGLISATGNITGGNLSGTLVTGTLTTAAQPNVTSLGSLTTLTVTGNANVGNLGTAGLIVATGNVTGGNLVTAGQVSATGNVTGGNINLSGNIVDTGALFLITGASGNITLAPNGSNVVIATTTGANITGTLNATGNANVGNLGTSGNITAAFYFGNGSQLTGISAASSASLANGTSNVAIPVSNGNVNTSVGGVPNVLVVSSTSANVAGNVEAAAYVANNYIATKKTISTGFTIQTDVNAMSLGPVTINDGVVITVPDSSTWYIGTPA